MKLLLKRGVELGLFVTFLTISEERYLTKFINFICGLILTIIYQKFDPYRKLGLTEKLEQAQYSAALAVTGTWRGTNRQRLYEELGWEDLYSRRRYRRLCHFYQLRLTRSPGYLFSELPCERHIFRTHCLSGTYYLMTLKMPGLYQCSREISYQLYGC